MVHSIVQSNTVGMASRTCGRGEEEGGVKRRRRRMSRRRNHEKNEQGVKSGCTEIVCFVFAVPEGVFSLAIFSSVGAKQKTKKRSSIGEV